MQQSLTKILEGYKVFRKKYATSDKSIMLSLADSGQKPQIMVVACCDSRVDPALILQCDPGDLFVVRNVANIVPPYEKDEAHHGTSAALEFGVRFLKVKHLILLGHSQCGGIHSLLHKDENLKRNDFIDNWVSLLQNNQDSQQYSVDEYAQLALKRSRKNCMEFPWVKEKVLNNELMIHLWFFDIKTGSILRYCDQELIYKPLI